MTFEHQRSARNIALAVHQAAMTSQLVERQSWLVDELQHALGQPLQGLHDWYTKALDALSDCGASNAQLVPLTEGFELALELVQEARQRLASYAKMGHVVNPSEFRVLQVEPMLRHCARFLGPVAQKKRCTIKLDIRPVQPVSAHQVFLRAAISNLIENAIKYSYKNRESEIIVSLDEEESGVVRMVFENFGVGIPRQDIERIFEPYYRSRVPDAKGERPGSGIGLALVKHAIEHVHDGEVRAESYPPKHQGHALSEEDALMLPHLTRFTVTLHRDRLGRLAASRDGKEPVHGN